MEDETVKGDFLPTRPIPMAMAMATMTAVVEGMAMTMTVITTIATTLTMTNVIIPEVVLAHDLIAQTEIGAQVVHTVKATNDLNILHPLITIMWSLAMKEMSTHSKLMRRANARC